MPIKHDVYEVENGHEWCRSQSTVAPGDYCRLCMCMRPKGSIGPCTGRPEITLRDSAAAEDNQPLSVGGSATKVNKVAALAATHPSAGDAQQAGETNDA